MFSDDGASGVGSIIYAHNSGGTDYMTFATASTERMRIDTNGVMGFGTAPQGTNSGTIIADGNVYSKDGFGTTGTDLTLIQPSATNTIFTKDNGNETMRIDSSGNVGIGAAPSTTGFGGTFKYLGVQGGSGYGVFNGQTTSTGVNDGAASFFGSTVGTAGSALLGGMQVINIASSASNAEGGLLFYTGSGGSIPERMRIDNSGKVYIATTVDLGGKLNIVGSNGQAIGLRRSGSTGAIVTFQFGATDVGNIEVGASSTSYNTSSDARLKNVLGEAKGLEIINKLNPVNFEWKESKEIQDGLIAQEVEPVVSNAVSINDDGYYVMDYSKLVTPLIKAIQEQQAVIEDLKTRIETLEG